MKKVKYLLYFIFVVILTYLALHFVYVPQFIDKKNNSIVASTETPPVPEPELHQKLFVADLHADSLLWERDLSARSARGHVDVPRMLEGNIALQAFSLVTRTPKNISIGKNDSNSDNIFWLTVFQGWPFKTFKSLKQRALYQIDKFHKAVSDRNDFYFISDKISLEKYLQVRLANPHITAGWITIEGAHALEDNLDNLDELYDAGVRMISPAHLADNGIGGSQQGAERYGLTDLGRSWVKKMNEKSMIIDLAHASAATIDEVLNLSSAPIIVSHTGVKGTCDNNRNLTDEQIRKIASKGGLLGIGFWPTATCGTSVEDIVKAILYVRKLVGVQHVALGSDWDGYVTTPVDASQVGQITGALIQANVPASDIALIMGGNVLEFLKKNLP